MALLPGGSSIDFGDGGGSLDSFAPRDLPCDRLKTLGNGQIKFVYYWESLVYPYQVTELISTIPASPFNTILIKTDNFYGFCVYKSNIV